MAYDQIGMVVKTPQFKLNQEHYDKIIADKPKRQLVYEAVHKTNTGDAYYLKPGWVLRLEQRHETTQIHDWTWWRPDLKEFGSYANTFLVEGSYLRKYSRVWSSQHTEGPVGGMRPMATMIADECPDDFGPGKNLGYVPHWWYYHCSPEWHAAGYPHLPAEWNSCHMNFYQAAMKLPEVAGIEDVEMRKLIANWIACTPNFQTFQPMKYLHDESGQHRWDLKPCTPVPPGTGIEFYSEMEQYCLLSCCPHGDQNKPIDEVQLQDAYISVWDTGIDPLEPAKWPDWRSALEGQIERGEKDISVRTPDSYTK